MTSNDLSPTAIMTEIKLYLDQYRKQHSAYDSDPEQDRECQMVQLTTEDISRLKGCQIRSVKTQEQDYKRGWAKLAKAQKLNRLMEYHQRLSKDYNLTVDQQGQLKSLFYDSIDILVRDQVIYDSSSANVVKIEGLKRDHDHIFFLAPMHDHHSHGHGHGSGEGNVDTHIQNIRKFTPVSIEQLSTAQIRTSKLKLKPNIVKRD